MAGSAIKRRLVFCIGGFDPKSPEMLHRRFVRELQRFQNTWSATSSVSEPVIDADVAAWTIVTAGPNWRVDTRYHVVRWDDVMHTIDRSSVWRRIVLGLLACLEFIAAGAVWRYLRTNWRYAVFLLYPILLLATVLAAAWVAYALTAAASGSTAVGAVGGLLVFIALLHVAGRWLYLLLAFDGWVFSSAYIRRTDPVLEQRFERVAQEIRTAALRSEADEILVVGHSLGAVFAVDILDRALRIEPTLGMSARVSFLSIGSSILKIGLHRGATRFRAALGRVAAAPEIFWAEYQVLIDVMNFYGINPVTALGLPAQGPVTRVVWFKKMLEPASYRHLRRNFFRIHNQFISGNDRRAEYDYFMILCGPLSLEDQIGLPQGPVSEIGEDGAWVNAPAHDGATHKGAQHPGGKLH